VWTSPSRTASCGAISFSVNEHNVLARSFHECANRGLVQVAEYQMAFPISGGSSTIRLGWSKGDRDRWINESRCSTSSVATRFASGSAVSGHRSDLALQRSRMWCVDRLVDGFGRCAHLGKVGEVLAESMTDLLR